VQVLWEKTVKFIKENISPQNFETWIKPINIISMEGNYVCLSVPNKFFKDWLLENYGKVIKNALASTSGLDFQVDFTIQNNHNGKSEHSHDNLQKKSEAPVTVKKSIIPRTSSSLNQNYSFERFVVGTSNQFAHAAAVSVAEQPAKYYNPLFIYGGVGLGKTHLLNAIGLQSLSLHPERNVLYVSAEEFMNELINSIRYDKMPKFREKYRNIWCLLIDDIQFIAGKERTQEEFFHTFNTLHDSGKQIVVTSDKFPRDIPNLEKRLRSRFEWGLVADIQPPEIETKIAIIEKKSQESKIVLPGNVAYFLAQQAESNIRELEGFLIRISAYASLTNREIDMPLAKEVFKKILKQQDQEDLTIEEIIKVVCGKLNIKINEVKSRKKNKNLALARQIAMYLSRKLTTASYPDIGEKIGGRDHSTVIYANKKVKTLIDSEGKMRELIEGIEDTLLHKT
jgi:chromosomal replication initiator protein